MLRPFPIESRRQYISCTPNQSMNPKRLTPLILTALIGIVSWWAHPSRPLTPVSASSPRSYNRTPANPDYSRSGPHETPLSSGNPSPVVPQAQLTPGATFPVTAADVCVRGYSKTVRNVPMALKDQVYEEYGIHHRNAGEYEIDHLISLELGGSNSIKNLWPESYITPINAHTKDALENRLHKLVCSGQLTLPQAQEAISKDWISTYTQYMGHAPQPR